MPGHTVEATADPDVNSKEETAPESHDAWLDEKVRVWKVLLDPVDMMGVPSGLDGVAGLHDGHVAHLRLLQDVVYENRVVCNLPFWKGETR